MVKNLPANAGDIRGAGSIPRSGTSPGGGKGYPCQYSGLENSMNQFMGLQRVRHDSATFTFTLMLFKARVGEGNGTPLQYSCLENPMDAGAWWPAVHGVTKSRTRLSDFPFTFHFHALEKEMATHSSVLAWRIPGTREPCGLLSMGSHRVGHD